MSVAQTAIRRRKQAVQGYTHLARHQRPIYRARMQRSVGEAIRLEKLKAQRMAAAQGKKKAKKGSGTR